MKARKAHVRFNMSTLGVPEWQKPLYKEMEELAKRRSKVYNSKNWRIG